MSEVMAAVEKKRAQEEYYYALCSMTIYPLVIFSDSSQGDLVPLSMERNITQEEFYCSLCLMGAEDHPRGVLLSAILNDNLSPCDILYLVTKGSIVIAHRMEDHRDAVPSHGTRVNSQTERLTTASDMV